MEVGERLRTAREAAGFSQEALHEEAGVTQATISAFELGKRKPRPSTLRKLGSALGVAPEWLAGEGADEGPDTAAVLLALIRGREARVWEAIDEGKAGVGTAKSANDLHDDIAAVVPMVRARREEITQAMIELKATAHAAYDAATKEFKGGRESDPVKVVNDIVEEVEADNTQAEGGHEIAGVRSA